MVNVMPYVVPLQKNVHTYTIILLCLRCYDTLPTAHAVALFWCSYLKSSIQNVYVAW